MQEFLKQAPTADPLTLFQVKEYLRITHDLEDATVMGMMRSACDAIEDACRISIRPQRWIIEYRLPEYRSDVFGVSPSLSDPERMMRGLNLSRGPVQTVNSIVLVGLAGDRTTFDPANYVFNQPLSKVHWVDQRPIVFGFDYDPAARPITMEVDITTGYKLWTDLNQGTKPDDVPDVVVPHGAILQAILLTTSSFYENRGDEDTNIPKKALQLMRPFWGSPRSAG